MGLNAKEMVQSSAAEVVSSIRKHENPKLSSLASEIRLKWKNVI